MAHLQEALSGGQDSTRAAGNGSSSKKAGSAGWGPLWNGASCRTLRPGQGREGMPRDQSCPPRKGPAESSPMHLRQECCIESEAPRRETLRNSVPCEMLENYFSIHSSGTSVTSALMDGLFPRKASHAALQINGTRAHAQSSVSRGSFVLNPF